MADKPRGIVLVPETQVYPELSFFSDPKALDNYKERIAKYGKRARSILDVFTFQDGIIKGSNPFAAVELASSRLALPSQLEHAVRREPDYFKGTYEDIALILITNGASYPNNDFVAKHLFEQVKHRTGREPTPEIPARISLKGLSLKEDSNSFYDLVFLLGENSEVVYAPEFSYKNNVKRFSRTNAIGIPMFDANGGRRFYSTKNNGLFRLYLYGGLDLNSDDDDLSCSNAVGRVAVVSAEGAQKNLEHV